MSSSTPFLYISGPMRGRKNLNREAFMDAEARLIHAGYRVFNPADADVRTPIGIKAGFADYMERDIAELGLEGCRGLALLDGWKHSEGARIEVAIINVLGKQARPLEVWEALDPEAAFSPLLEAQRLVFGARQSAYGHPADDFECSATVLRAYTKRRYGVDIPFTSDFIGLFMAGGIKGSREAGQHRLDSCVDGAGYWATIQRCKDRRIVQAEG